MSNDEFKEGLERGRNGEDALGGFWDRFISYEDKKNREAGHREGLVAKANADAIAEVLERPVRDSSDDEYPYSSSSYSPSSAGSNSDIFSVLILIIIVGFVAAYGLSQLHSVEQRPSPDEPNTAEERIRQERIAAEEKAAQEKYALETSNNSDLETARQMQQSGNLIAAAQYINAILARAPNNHVAREYQLNWKLDQVCTYCGVVLNKWEETVDGAGPAIGGVAGYAVGKQAGGDVAPVVGAITGALIGKMISSKIIYNVELQMDTGIPVTYQFYTDIAIQPGQRIFVENYEQGVTIAPLVENSLENQ